MGGDGLSSYPHPRLMPDFWEYPTVSMGLGPVNAIAQAHLARYLAARGLADTSQSRVWGFVGDGEFDEPETMALLGMAGREHLDNLTLVVNCNLQRLDGPVRGNGKVIQEFEATLRGAGWNVIKVVWGRTWDDLLARDVDGLLLARMNETVDGEFQKYATESGAYIREHFFGPDPRLQALVAHLSDAELQSLPRGGHDYRKLYAAYRAAVEHTGAPTAILAKTVKGWTLGPEIESRNATHQIKKMTRGQLRALRDRLSLQDEIAEADLDADLPPYCRPDPDSPVGRYLAERRRALGGPLPQPGGACRAAAGTGPGGVRRPARRLGPSSGVDHHGLRPPPAARSPATRGSVAASCPSSRTRPGPSDWSRSISEVQIYAPGGQRYTPVDAGLALHYAEGAAGQVLQEGITETGATATFTAAATSYATWGEALVPCYLFYSMFGFQRVGDLLWALGDAPGSRLPARVHGRAHHPERRGPPAPGRPLAPPGVGLPVGGRLRPGVRLRGGVAGGGRHPADDRAGRRGPLLVPDPVQRELPDAGPARRPGRGRAGASRHHPRPLPLRRAPRGRWPPTPPVPASCSREPHGGRPRRPGGCWPTSGAWPPTPGRSPRTSRSARTRCRPSAWNRLHPDEPAPVPLVTESLGDGDGPVVAVTDYVRAVPDQVARWVPRPFTSLGTDGFGRSDTREVLRRFFEIDAAHVVVAVLGGLERRRRPAPGNHGQGRGRLRHRPRRHRPLVGLTVRRPFGAGPTGPTGGPAGARPARG